jgi:hypothetical protein
MVISKLVKSRCNDRDKDMSKEQQLCMYGSVRRGPSVQFRKQQKKKGKKPKFYMIRDRQGKCVPIFFG